MKVGLRIPSPTKSIKARTTGRIKRATKSSYNPIYGKDGVGYLKDPERAIKNKVYHKVTVDSLDNVKKKAVKSSHSKILVLPMLIFYFLAIISGAYTEIEFLLYRTFNVIGVCICVMGFVLFALFYTKRYS